MTDPLESRRLSKKRSFARRFGPELLGARLSDCHRDGRTSVEQQSNLYHLLSQVLAYGVEGALVEIGPMTGTSAVMAQWIVGVEGAGQPLQVFEGTPCEQDSPRAVGALSEPFLATSGIAPIFHTGDLRDTIPRELPAQIAYVNLDCGYGLTAAEHAALLAHLLAQLYPRLARGAVCSLFEYWRGGWHDHIYDAHPGVRPAADAFMADKPEKITVLHGGERAHAYFRKL